MSNLLHPTAEADFTFCQDKPFRLTGGGVLRPVNLHYTIYGDLNPEADNVLLVCHALSGSARVADWWEEMFGPEQPFDLDRFCVIGVNLIGSCYGSTGPTSINPETGRPYGGDFPVVSVLDTVRAQAKLLDHLGVDRLYAAVGGSIGGMQALLWATEFPERIQRSIAIGVAPLNAMGLALNHIQRQAIRDDPAWRGGNYSIDDPPSRGLALARGLAMCSYKSPELFEERYGRKPNRNGEVPHRSHEGRYDVAGYLDYQGRRFLERFDANSYLAITRAMDTFDFGATPEEEAANFQRIQAKVLLVGISSDWLFPAADVQALADRMAAAGVDVRYLEQSSHHGHDGFLADAADLAPMILPALHEEVMALRG